MKKFLALILAMCTCLALGTMLSACSLTQSVLRHTHSYSQRIEDAKFLKSEATCSSKAIYYMSCSCGEVGEKTFESGEFGDHSYSLAWSIGDGKHVRVCMYNYEHRLEENCSGGQATCMAKAKCSVCSSEYGELGEHDFALEWSVNQEYHWKECKTDGCSVKTDEGMHDYTNGDCICVNNTPDNDDNNGGNNDTQMAIWESALENAKQYGLFSENEYEISADNGLLQRFKKDEFAQYSVQSGYEFLGLYYKRNEDGTLTKKQMDLSKFPEFEYITTEITDPSAVNAEIESMEGATIESVANIFSTGEVSYSGEKYIVEVQTLLGIETYEVTIEDGKIVQYKHEHVTYTISYENIEIQLPQ